MKQDKLIEVNHLCKHYNIEITFVRSLHDYGLIEIIRSEENECIEEDKLNELERLLHLHNDLEINLESIDAIRHLLKRMDEMQHELKDLRNKLGHGPI